MAALAHVAPLTPPGQSVAPGAAAQRPIAPPSDFPASLPRSTGRRLAAPTLVAGDLAAQRPGPPGDDGFSPVDPGLAAPSPQVLSESGVAPVELEASPLPGGSVANMPGATVVDLAPPPPRSALLAGATARVPQSSAGSEWQEWALGPDRAPAPGSDGPRSRGRDRSSFVTGSWRRLGWSAMSILALVALLGIGLGVAVGVLIDPPSAEATSSADAEALAGQATRSPALVGCRTGAEAKRLAESVVSKVPVGLLAPRESGTVAAAFAVARGSALGLTIDVSDLSTRVAYRHTTRRQVLGVSPVELPSGIDFHVDEAAVGGLKQRVSLPGEPESELAVSAAGVVFATRNPPAERVLWPLGPSAKVGRLAVAETAGGGYAVAFRRGGRAGSVVVAWVGAGGRRHSALHVVPFAGEQVGEPALAARGDELVMAVASRESAAAPWTLQLAVAARGQAPHRVRSLSLVRGGPGGGAKAPRVAAIEHGRWFLQWTEGGSGHHVVRAITLGADLGRLGDSVAISPEGLNAGAGALVGIDGGAFSAFLGHVAGRYELWGTVLSCR